MSAVLEAPAPTHGGAVVQEPVKLSATRIKLFMRCPRAYRYQYVDKIPTQITGALAFGNVIHQVLHNIHQWSLAHGEPLNESVALYEFARIWDETVEQDDPLFKDDSDLIGYTDLGKLILTGYIEEHRDKPQPILLEHHFEIEVSDGCSTPYRVRGVIDRVDEESNGLVIVDFKTGKQKPSPKMLREDLQLTLYAWAAKEVFGQRVKKVVYYFLRKHAALTVERSEDELAVLTGVVLPHVASGIAREHFDPRPGYYCRFCDYRHLCAQEGGADVSRYEPKSQGDEALGN